MYLVFAYSSLPSPFSKRGRERSFTMGMHTQTDIQSELVACSDEEWKKSVTDANGCEFS